MRWKVIGFAKTSQPVFHVLKGWMFALTNVVKLSIPRVRSISKKSLDISYESLVTRKNALKPIAFHVTIQAGYHDRSLAIANTQLDVQLAVVDPQLAVVLPSTALASAAPQHPAGDRHFLTRRTKPEFFIQRVRRISNYEETITFC